MISRLRGQVLEVALDHGGLDVGGVGLTVHTTPAVLAELSVGQQADLATVLLVRGGTVGAGRPVPDGCARSSSPRIRVAVCSPSSSSSGATCSCR